ncbi:MAG: TetR/AcrR family transcriptional regulator [Acidimicrobiales bacterium]
MSGPVKRRAYDTTGRQARSAATRQRILDAAGDLIVQRGYGQTTMAAVAAAAAVHVDTVYALVGRKPDVVSELVERALSGTDQAIPAVERPYVAQIRAASAPESKLAVYARATREMLPRVAPLFVALRDAAGRDRSARRLCRQFSDRRAANMRLFVQDLADAGGLRPGIDIDEAADTVWATNSPELYVMLTDERGWSSERFENWLLTTWSRLLLP